MKKTQALSLIPRDLRFIVHLHKFKICLDAQSLPHAGIFRFKHNLSFLIGGEYLGHLSSQITQAAHLAGT